MYKWIYYDFSRCIWGLYLPHDPEKTRVERNIPPNQPQYKVSAYEMIDALNEATELSIG